jgi:endothelin-converting enzyme/putative endopeptidase
MSPQTVNAYNPSYNEIVPSRYFTAAVLQLQADEAVNYGGIGGVIGHEIFI